MAGLERMAEALQGASDTDDVDKRIEDALACPCIGDLKEGPCGPSFVHAFTCFIKSEHEDKGMDCLEQFKGFQACLQRNPEHLEKIMREEEEAHGLGLTWTNPTPSSSSSSSSGREGRRGMQQQQSPQQQ